MLLSTETSRLLRFQRSAAFLICSISASVGSPRNQLSTQGRYARASGILPSALRRRLRPAVPPIILRLATCPGGSAFVRVSIRSATAIASAPRRTRGGDAREPSRLPAVYTKCFQTELFQPCDDFERPGYACGGGWAAKAGR